jgi:hypothetical protein
MQLSGETCVSQSKQMKAKRLAFAFFYFSESLVFNGLRGKNKKIRFGLTSRLGLCANVSGVLSSSHQTTSFASSVRRTGKFIPQDSALEKDLRRFRTLANGLLIDRSSPFLGSLINSLLGPPTQGGL